MTCGHVHLSVEPKSQPPILPVVECVLFCFFYPSPSWETSLRQKGLGGENNHFYLGEIDCFTEWQSSISAYIETFLQEFTVILETIY